MLDASVRPLKDAVLAPLTRASAKLHPNTITVAALAAGVVCAAAAALGAYVLALALWASNRVLDGLDGTVARLTARQSDLGGYLDIVFDFLVYALVPLGIAVGLEARGTPAWPATAWLLGSFYVNATSWLYLAAVLEKRAEGARAKGEQTTVTMPEGLIAGTETTVFFTLFLIWPARAPQFFWIMAFLVAVTAGQRLVAAVRRLR